MDVCHAHHLCGRVQAAHVLEVCCCLIMRENTLPLHFQWKYLNDDSGVIIDLVDLRDRIPRGVSPSQNNTYITMLGMHTTYTIQETT